MKNNNILLVEDDVFLSKAYAYFLRKAGFNVLVANDGAQALQMVTKARSNIILLDLIMPIMNGFETLAALKKNKATKHIPVIIVSNLAQDSEREECLRMGAVDYLIKSDFMMKDVVEKIHSHLDKAEAAKK